MVSVEYDEVRDSYFVSSAGRVISEHQKSSAAKRAAKAFGRKHGEAVSYRGPRMSSAKFILRP